MFARPGLPSFDYVRADTPGQVVDLLEQHGQTARLLMGGTDLFPGMRDGLLRPKVVVDVKHLPGLRDIRYDGMAGLTVGAAVTMNQLVSHPDVCARYPLLVEAANSVASYQIRNRATLGGNLCNASPCADTAPAVIVLGAEILLYGRGGTRAVPAQEFVLGPGQTVIQDAEFMTGVRFPLPEVRQAARYLKLGRCRAGDLALVGVAVLGCPAGTASGYRFRIGLGSVAPTPIRAVQAEDILSGQPPAEESFALAAEKAMEDSSPISDVRAGAAYQRAMVRIMTRRGLHDVWEQLRAR